MELRDAVFTRFTITWTSIDPLQPCNPEAEKAGAAAFHDQLPITHLHLSILWAELNTAWIQAIAAQFKT